MIRPVIVADEPVNAPIPLILISPFCVWWCDDEDDDDDDIPRALLKWDNEVNDNNDALRFNLLLIVGSSSFVCILFDWYEANADDNGKLVRVIGTNKRILNFSLVIHKSDCISHPGK